MKNLVFCSTSIKSKPTPELFGKDREFDVCLHYYDAPEDYIGVEELIEWVEPKGVWHWYQQGEKLEVAFDVIPHLPAYSQYAFLDDDLTVSTGQLNQLFRIGDSLGLPLYQPALTTNSYSSHSHLYQSIGREVYPVRKVPFVEIMCPFFSWAALSLCLPTFNRNISAWGLDLYVWPLLVDGYVIDSLAIGHMRMPGRRDRVLRNGLTPMEECAKLKEEVDREGRIGA